MNLSKLPGLKQLAHDLPSPISVPLDKILTGLDDGDYLRAYLAGMDAFFSALKFVTFVGIADLMQKLEDDHPFASDENLKAVFPYIKLILEPKPSHGHWISCIRSIMQIYKKEPQSFFIPEFMALQVKKENDPLRFEERLDRLVKIRNRGAHTVKSLPAPGEARSLWDQIDPLLGGLYNQLAVFKDYNLVQFDSMLEVDGPGSYRCSRFLQIKGYRMNVSDLRRKGAVRFFFGKRLPRLRQLYLFNRDFRRYISLHPFLIFDLGTEFQRSDTCATLLFRELLKDNITYESMHERNPLELKLQTGEDLNDEAPGQIAGSISKYFAVLKTITGDLNIDRRKIFRGLGRRSLVLNFSQIIAFHTEGFSGRTDYFEQVEHAISGPFRCAWVRGLAGYGKTAFIAKLAQQHPKAIHYFISPEKGTANASTFLLHMSQAIINLFHFPDMIAESETANLEELKKTFYALLHRAAEETGDAEKLLILIDGVDESERYASRPEENIYGFLPQNKDEIPGKVFFVVSSRPDELDFSHLADIVVDLQPFSHEEVINILQFHGWDKKSADTAYKKSSGQPLYFRFLVEGIKTKVLQSKNASYLPEGIMGFYKRFWLQWEREKSQRKDREKALRGALIQDILGFLAASGEPLSDVDLYELTKKVDADLELKDIRSALLKKNLGKFIIGTKRFSLFHDTLREFILETTRLPGDDLPYGEANKYHEVLAEWCLYNQERDYGEKYRIFHLLYSRQYQVVIQLLEDNSKDGMLSRKMAREGGAIKLARELEYGILAARELNDLEKVFRFSFLQLAINSLRKTSAIPEAAILLSRLEKEDELDQLLEEFEEDDQKWRTASTVYAYALKEGKTPVWNKWSGILKELWLNMDDFKKSSQLKSLIAQLQNPSKADVQKTINLFPEVDQDMIFDAVVEGLKNTPTLAARLIMDMDIDTKDPLLRIKSKNDELVILAHRLLAGGEERLALQMLSILGLQDLEEGILFLPAFFNHYGVGILDIFHFKPDEYDDWDDVGRVLAFMRMLSRQTDEVPVSWLSEQPSPVQALCYCYIGVESGNAESISRAVEVFRYECANLSAICNLSCLTMLSLAQQKSGSEQDPWQKILMRLIGMVEKSTGAFRMVDDLDDELEEDMKSRLPKAGKYLEEIGHLFSDMKSAFWFSLAAASPALESMLNPEVQEWIRMKLKEREVSELPPEAEEILEAVTHSLYEKLEYSNDKEDIQEMVLPVLFGFLEQDAIIEKIKILAPFERVRHEENFALLTPDFDLGRFESLYPYLYDEEGDLINVNKTLEAKICYLAFQDPVRAFHLWQELSEVDKERVKMAKNTTNVDSSAQGLEETEEDEYDDIEDDDLAGFHDSDLDGDIDQLDDEFKFDEVPLLSPSLPEDEDLEKDRKPEKLDAKNLVAILHTNGLYKEAFEILKMGKASENYLDLFCLQCKDLFPEFLEELIFISNNLGFLDEEAFHNRLETVLEQLPREDNRIEIERILSAPEAGPDLKITLSRYALLHGVQDITLKYLSTAVKKQPLPEEKLSKLVIPWIEKVIDDDVNRAARMWEEYVAFLRMQGLVFISHLQESFDNKISRRIEDNLTETSVLSTLASSFGPDLKKSRLAAAVAITRGGGERKTIEPLLSFTEIDDILYFARGLSGMAIPGWLRENLHEAFHKFINESNPAAYEFMNFVTMLIASFWEADQRSESIALLLQKLANLEGSSKEESEKKELHEWHLLLDAFNRGEYAELTAIDPEKKTGLPGKITQIASLNPGFAWQVIEKISTPETQAIYRGRVFTEVLETDLPWAMETLAPQIKTDDSWDLLGNVLRVTKSDQWPLVEGFVRYLAEALPYGIELHDKESMIKLIETYPDLAVKIFKKTKYQLGWIDFFCEENMFGAASEKGPTPELFLEMAQSELPHWKQALIDLANNAHVDQYDIGNKIESLIGYLGKISGGKDRERIVNELLDAVETLVQNVKKDRKDNIEEFIKKIAPVFPEKAVSCIEKFNYKGIHLDDIIKSILEAKPELFERVYQGIIHKMDRFDKSRILVPSLARMTLKEALTWLKREKIEADELAYAIAQAQEVNDEEMSELLRLVGDDLEKHFKLYTAALLTAGNTNGEKQEKWLHQAWEIFSKGEFYSDRSSRDIQFRFPGSHGFGLGLGSLYGESPLGILYAFKPDEMERYFRKLQNEASVEQQPKYQKMFNEIKKNSLLPLFRISSKWIIKHLKEWKAQPWWPKYLSDDLFEIITRMLSEDALMVLAAFEADEKKLSTILDQVKDPDEMRECLEVLISELMIKNPTQSDQIIDLCIEYSPRVGIAPMDLLIRWADQLQDIKRILGVQSLDQENLILKIHSIATSAGKETISEQEEDETGGEKLDEKALKASLSQEDRKTVEVYETTIRHMIKNNEDQSMVEALINLKRKILLKGVNIVKASPGGG